MPTSHNDIPIYFVNRPCENLTMLLSHAVLNTILLVRSPFRKALHLVAHCPISILLFTLHQRGIRGFVVSPHHSSCVMSGESSGSVKVHGVAADLPTLNSEYAPHSFVKAAQRSCRRSAEVIIMPMVAPFERHQKGSDVLIRRPFRNTATLQA
ncbi:hypothetical protein BC832DRAFT_426273 [Gaertneriomyces semiglobifer]|nr:hypothetical protein BC832DRAFT_426273 [Gaertneriomyces semiglobifer]